MSAPAPVRRPHTRGLAAIAAVALGAILLLGELTQPLDEFVYGALMPAVAPPPSPRIVTIAVDAAGTKQPGGRPESRRLHARLIDRLTEAGVRGIGLDLPLSHSALYDPEGDALLARAIRRNGRVVLPVHAQPGAAAAPVVELLPIPELADAAAALGHVDAAPDADGVVRTLYLHAGPGSTRWPAMALALSRFEPATADSTSLSAFALASAIDAHRWVRADPVRPLYAHPLDGFMRLSQADVLEGRTLPPQLRGAWVLVGDGARSDDRRLHVPASWMRRAVLSPLQHQAHALNALLSGHVVHTLALPWQVLLTALLVVLPLLLARRAAALRMRWLMPAALGLVVFTSWALLEHARLWFPPGSALAVLLSVGTLVACHQVRAYRNRSHTDVVTGLPNGPGFAQMLATALRASAHSGQPVSLLLLQLDRGRSQLQAAGGQQALLRQLGGRLAARARRPQDRVAHLGQGRFAILLPDTPAHAAAAIATTMHVDLGGHSRTGAPGSVSIGLHTFDPATPTAAPDLLQGAQRALQQARVGGGNTSVHYRSPPPPPLESGRSDALSGT